MKILNFEVGHLVATDDFALAEVLAISRNIGLVSVRPLVGYYNSLITDDDPLYYSKEEIRMADPETVYLWQKSQIKQLENANNLAIATPSPNMFLAWQVRRQKILEQLANHHAGWLQ